MGELGGIGGIQTSSSEAHEKILACSLEWTKNALEALSGQLARCLSSMESTKRFER